MGFQAALSPLSRQLSQRDQGQRVGRIIHSYSVPGTLPQGCFERNTINSPILKMRKLGQEEDEITIHEQYQSQALHPSSQMLGSKLLTAAFY